MNFFFFYVPSGCTAQTRKRWKEMNLSENRENNFCAGFLRHGIMRWFFAPLEHPKNRLQHSILQFFFLFAGTELYQCCLNGAEISSFFFFFKISCFSCFLNFILCCFLLHCISFKAAAQKNAILGA